jgi:hypothetical protein
MLVSCKQRTQRAAQLLAASELVRRDYAVSLPAGADTPDADLIVATQTGAQFWVDVKGLSSNEWLITPTQSRSSLYHILVRVYDTRDQDRFFILPQSEVDRLLQECNSISAIPFLYLEIFENKWEMLPPARRPEPTG